MAELINVDRKNNDTFYRYKMPAVAIKVEGNGNGIKTVFTNIHDVCAKLNRPEEILLKFFGSELGAQATYFRTDDKYQVMGQFARDRVQEKVYDFIDRFVLCGVCRNPETNIITTKRDGLMRHCRSCGEDSGIGSHEKIFKQVLEFYKKASSQPAAASAASASDAPPPPDMSSPTAATAGAIPVAAVVTTASSRIESTGSAVEGNPIDKLADFLSLNDDQEVRLRYTYELKTKYASLMTREKHLGDLAFLAVLNSNKVSADKWIGTLQRNRTYLAHFADRKEIRDTFIAQCLVKCEKQANAKKFPMALKMLFEEGIIQDTDVDAWYQVTSGTTKVASKAFVAEAKIAVKPLVDWLGVSAAKEEGAPQAAAAPEA